MRYRALVAVGFGVLSACVAAPRAQGSSPDWSRLQDETLRHFQALVRLDTSNPPGNEHLVTSYVKSVLENESIPVRIYALDPKRPNLVARVKGSGRRQPILYMGHSDVVTVDPRSGSSRRSAPLATAGTSTAAERSTTSRTSSPA
jgi:hypothetical protein